MTFFPYSQLLYAIVRGCYLKRPEHASFAKRVYEADARGGGLGRRPGRVPICSNNAKVTSRIGT